MRSGTIRFAAIREAGSRLTAGFHLSEDQQAVRTLSRAKRTDALGDLVAGRGIFRGPIFKRQYAADPSFGRPYVSAKDLVRAEIRPPAFLSKRHGRLLADLELKEGMILLTCSGMNLGKALWTRTDMDGLCASHDLIRIEAASGKVPPGYLFAFLASHHGRVSIRRQIYGGNIKHIEPSHLIGLPVPRLTRGTEQRISDRVLEAATARSEAARLREEARTRLHSILSLEPAPDSVGPESRNIFTVASTNLRRLDAHHFNPLALQPATELASHSSVEALGTVAKVFTPGIFKRQHVDDPSFGFPYFSGSELFQVTPQPRGHLSRTAPGIEAYVVEKNWLLVQDAGQLGGLIGQVTRVGETVAGGVVSNHLMRIVPSNQRDAAFLFAVLSIPHGRLALTRHAFGSSIPQLDPQHIGHLQVPWPDERKRAPVVEKILRGWELEDLAVQKEASAIADVERAIEEAA